MLNWFAILRRIMSLYNVKTQQELGMALGAPMHIGMEDKAGVVIPWPILEITVMEKKVSWDWLLTGKGPSPQSTPSGTVQTAEGNDQREPASGGATGSIQANFAAAKSPAGAGMPPRFETRELERRLLAKDAYREPEAETGMDVEGGGEPESDSVIRELEEVRETMRREMDRLERLLEERKRE